MDFNSFDSRTAADEGRPLHFTHPDTGELLWDDGGPQFDEAGNELPRSRPCIAHVLGTEGRRAQEIGRETAKLPALPDEATLEDYHARLCATARQLVTGFDNIDRGERPATAADVDWVLGLNLANPAHRGKGRSFVEQILTFSGSRGHYLGKSGAASSEPPSKSGGKTRAPKAGSARARKT